MVRRSNGFSEQLGDATAHLGDLGAVAYQEAGAADELVVALGYDVNDQFFCHDFSDGAAGGETIVSSSSSTTFLPSARRLTGVPAWTVPAAP